MKHQLNINNKWYQLLSITKKHPVTTREKKEGSVAPQTQTKKQNSHKRNCKYNQEKREPLIA